MGLPSRLFDKRSFAWVTPMTFSKLPLHTGKREWPLSPILRLTDSIESVTSNQTICVRGVIKVLALLSPRRPTNM